MGIWLRLSEFQERPMRWNYFSEFFFLIFTGSTCRLKCKWLLRIISSAPLFTKMNFTRKKKNAKCRRYTDDSAHIQMKLFAIGSGWWIWAWVRKYDIKWYLKILVKILSLLANQTKKNVAVVVHRRCVVSWGDIHTQFSLADGFTAVSFSIESVI